ncbi:MAG: hydrolase 1, exosortase A system-associated [Propionivibrio sp.]|uniref:hydrolase 1, exosortase A system-associated n=1 Tax=Propionivibrio sp. TaxID=2212460 RepID=UPI0025DA334C|nr:hydrolase 1, exosortase A system-associated [Propionivibrio sp.]MBK8894999.1 hydrolase 1, exosortase A system-associated [Propionivibrio sp.]
MNYAEQAVVFPVGGEQLLGIVATPDTPIDCGVLIVVGGPQYRVGSHRQFLLLTRRLAAEGYPTMRFDYRGMGDSDGAMRNFEEVTDDIGAALDTFQSSCPTIRRVVLWGLCDAASSALLYVQATRDSRIAGLVLLNPWVRSEASLAQTHIKHYYGQRLLQREFWIKLLSGKLSLFQSVRGLVTSALKARGTSDHAEGEIRSFQDRMAEGLRQFSGRVLLILSGEDYTAKEFLEYAGANAAWSGLLDTDRISRVEPPDADHTFSAQALRLKVEDATLDWLASLER